MWSDTETTKDLLNFKVVADSIANIIINSNNEPMSIGISGSWGVGKSSLVKMIGESIRNNDKNNEYIFIDLTHGCIKVMMMLKMLCFKRLLII